MKKFVVVAIILVFLAVVAGADVEGNAIDANGNWFEESSRVGYDAEKGYYYWTVEMGLDYTPWERAEMKIADSYTGKVINLDDDMVEYLRGAAQ